MTQSVDSEALHLLPYQEQFADRVLESQVPARIVLIAPSGTGKSVAVAAAIRSIADRVGGFYRFLVVAPRALCEMWRDRLTQLGLSAILVDIQSYRQLQLSTPAKANPWAAFGCAVTSVDFLKRPERLREVLGVRWNAVVLDECHQYTASSARGDVAKALVHSSTADKVIALSGTMQNCNSLLDVADTDLVTWRLPELRDVVGRRLFARAEYEFLNIEVSAAENQAGEQLRHALHLPEGARVQEKFVAKMLWQRVLSSLYTGEQSLRRLAAASPSDPVLYNEAETVDEPADSERAEWLESPEYLTREVLVRLLRYIEDISVDSKLKKSLELLRQPGWSENTVIFTDFAETAEFVTDSCRNADIAVQLITAKLTLDQRGRIMTQVRLEPQVLIVTSAAVISDLGFFQRAIHYDLPFAVGALLKRMRHRIPSHTFLVDPFSTNEGNLEELQHSLKEFAL